MNDLHDLDGIVAEFLVESGENLDQLDRDLVALEQEPTSRPLLSSVFRTIHTIKGTTGFLGFGHLEAVTHAGESLLSRLRDGDLKLSTEITDVLLAMVDAVRALLAAIEETGAEGSPDHSRLLAELARLQAPRADVPPALPSPAAVPAAAPPPVASPSPAAAAAPGAAPAPAPVPAPTAAPGPPPVPVGPVEHRSVADSSVRVDVDLLDALMRLVGELVLARNQLLVQSGHRRDVALEAAAARVDVITGDLQDGVLKTRMQPIETLLSKLPRLVRDLGATCGKPVTLVTEGGDTELDRSILEAVRDPLTHLVRNAVDHGLELPAARLAAGKPEAGTLRVRAFHAGGQVNIEVSDDGGGIDLARVAATAVRRGLVSAAAAAEMTPTEISSLIFTPGFSTAESITSVSGRGVGMDVVASNIEAVGGSVEVRTRPGAGTTFRVQIPLTLAIIPALLVTCAGQRYAVPQLNVLEIVLLTGPDAVATVCGAPVHRLRGDLLPVLYLDRELGVARPAPAGADSPGVAAGADSPAHADSPGVAAGSDSPARADSAPLVVLEAEGQRFGLVVDTVIDTAEVVVKPMRPQPVPTAYGGATIMGDGRVALILDATGLARRADVLATGRTLRAADTGSDPGPPAAGAGQLLLTEVGEERLAIPLAAVERLEELAAGAVEHLGGRLVTQYQGGILPLLPLGGHPAVDPAAQGVLHVVVHVSGGRRVGLVVDAIIDAVPADAAAVPGASLVIDGRVTAVLDDAWVVRAAGHADLVVPAGAA